MEIFKKPLTDSEKMIQYGLSQAFADARQEAIKASLSVVEAYDDGIYEVFPDETKVFIKSINNGTFETGLGI